MTPTERQKIYAEIKQLEATTKRLKGLIYSYDKVTKRITDQRNQSFGEQVLTAVCKFYNVGTEEICLAAKPDRIAFPRRVAIYLYRMTAASPKPSLGQLGAIVNRDKTTANWAIRKVRQEIQQHESIAKEIEAIQQIILKEVKEKELSLV